MILHIRITILPSWASLPRWEGITHDGLVVRGDDLRFENGDTQIVSRGKRISVEDVVDLHVKKTIEKAKCA